MPDERDKLILRQLFHEMRSPVVAIRAIAESAAHSADSFDSVNLRRERLDDIETFAALLNNLISNAEAGLFPDDRRSDTHNDSEPTLIQRDVIMPTVNTARAMARHSGFDPGRIYFHDFGLIPRLRLPKLAMRQVILNILSNAIKYAHQDRSAFRVEISPHTTPSVISIRFSDYGIGFDERDLPHIFDEGFRGEEARRHSIAGQGMGLFVAKRILTELGGDIEIARSSNPTVISISLPHTSVMYRNA